MPRAVGFISFITGVLIVSAVLAYTDVRAAAPAHALAAPSTTAAQLSFPVDTPNPDSTFAAVPAPVSTPIPAPAVHPGWAPLAASIQNLVDAAGAQAGVQLIELGGSVPSKWSLNADTPFGAASDYKLVALMAEAQNIAAGRTDPRGLVCYQDGDYEDGWFNDYAAGACLSRNDLATRAGLYSDNTAGHMLVRDLGGSDALNAFARQYGATGSDFFENNTTTAHDLGGLWAAEVAGQLGGAAAQAWLYPVLTNSRYEAGIPAGLPAGSTAIHKTGELDLEVNDAALVTGGAGGPYVLVVLTDNAGDDAGWNLIAQVSATVAKYEAAR